ncbi:hypothetical protein RMSM_03237 [Rhodopirellula maiorica SM1]|uniref:DUF3124 domain-containing protein n=1 Tax=Rhodopirellula maiorica SM1 TaxID=1265738 RepID=M5RKK2_9BACT|nr:DUF3124 domain-containing protein [Rhodopirellula maiorica]EMI19848.1 hypothetical protein RMSM_03237 [Rhodopirellula maiorica SM1]
MMRKPTDDDSEKMMRNFKLIVFLTVVIPIVALTLFLEMRFEAIEDEIQFLEPGTRDAARTDLDALPWHPVQGQTLYAPAYSHIYHQSGEPRLLTVTLSARNTDRDNDIVLTSVRYYDTSGKERRSLVEKPLRLGPLASTEFVIEQKDKSGGSGASFIVEWKSGKPVNVPMVETVMIDTSNTQGISFVRSATVLEETKARVEMARDESAPTDTTPSDESVSEQNN